MKIQKIKAVYFSPTGNTRRVVEALTHRLGHDLNLTTEVIDFTLPGQRQHSLIFTPEDLVVFGTPVYAGRVPNKISPWIADHVQGNGAAAIPVVTFGNRSFDNAAAELRDLLETDGFQVIAAAAFCMPHAFTDKVAADRPDNEDRALLQSLAVCVEEKIREDRFEPVTIPGDGKAPYYVPKGTDGKPVNFLKATPKTDMEKCIHCGFCAELCPLGSIDYDHPEKITGICIKCQSCIQSCPVGARYFDNPAFLSHVSMLEQNFTRRAESQIFTDK
ncbi:MAG: EFR1 family ferrodoxin [Eubacteriaceae bacterium]